jgi:hypothetical protein
MEAATHIIEEELENLECFSKKKASHPYDKSEPLRNEISFHSEVGLVVINGQIITITDVNSKKYIILTPSNKIHPMHGGIINPSGNLLAIQGNNQILLISLSEEAKLNFMEQRDNGDEIRCKSQIIQLGPIHNNEIRKISWHPLSETHLVVLTNDSLRLYNTHLSPSEPEQRFYLTDALDPISFSFGGSSYLDSWQRFTIFILVRSGQIYAICPVVPYDCMIPVEHLSMLKDQMIEKGDDNALRWLKEIKGPNIKVDFKSPTGIKRINKRGNNTKYQPYNPAKPKKSFSAKFGDSDDDSSIEDEPEEQEKGYIRTKRPQSVDNNLLVQGPLADNDSKATKFECSDILSLPTTPTVIIRSFEDALIEVLLLFEDMQPKWGRETSMFSKQKDNSTMMLYERIDLGLPTYNSDMGPCRLAYGSNVSANNYEFYAFHGAGVHRIKLPYMSILSDSIFNSDPSRVEKESMPPSETSWLLNTLPLQSGSGTRPVVLVGFALVTAQGKNMILTRDADGNCHCASDSVSQANSKKFFNNLMDNLSQPNNRINIAFPPKVTKVSNLHFDKESQAIVYLIGQVEDRTKNQMAMLNQIELQLNEKLNSLTETYKEQQEMIVSSKNQKIAIDERYIKLHETITEVQTIQKDLTDRLNRAMNATLLLQKNLTRAEMKFHEELIGLKTQTSNQENEVDSLREQLNALDFKETNEKQVVKQKDRNFQKIVPILEQEGNMLAGIAQQTQELQCEVLKLYGLSVL